MIFKTLSLNYLLVVALSAAILGIHPPVTAAALGQLGEGSPFTENNSFGFEIDGNVTGGGETITEAYNNTLNTNGNFGNEGGGDSDNVIDTTKRGGVGGDPHFRTWSGVKYDYHGECDLVLVDHPSFANGLGLRVHIRTTRRQYFSYIDRVALQIGNDILEFASRDDVLYNGQNMGAATKFAGYQVNTFKSAISVRLNDKAKARIDFLTRRSGTPYVVLDGGATTLFRGSLGLVGDWATGKMTGRDGETVFVDPDEFAAEWQVRDDEPMLFVEARAPQYPTRCIPPQRILGNRLGDSHMRAAAEKQCSAWKEDKEDCIFDVMATRDIHAADEPFSFIS